MTPHKSEACRVEIEMLLEYDMIEPSKSPWACGVVIGVVPVEEDVLRLVQRNGHFSKTDGSGFDQSDKDVRESCETLRG